MSPENLMVGTPVFAFEIVPFFRGRVRFVGDVTGSFGGWPTIWYQLCHAWSAVP